MVFKVLYPVSDTLGLFKGDNVGLLALSLFVLQIGQISQILSN